MTTDPKLNELQERAHVEVSRLLAEVESTFARPDQFSIETRTLLASDIAVRVTYELLNSERENAGEGRG